MHKSFESNAGGASRQTGGTLTAVLLILMLLGVFMGVRTLLLQKNMRQSNFYSAKASLRLYATSAVHLSLHDLNLNISGKGGNIGTVNWTPANDVGRDGRAGTRDEGEGDGLPTAGEPNVAPVPVGPPREGNTMIAWVTDTAWSNIKRIVGRAYRDGVETTVEVYGQKGTGSLPMGATYLKPGVTVAQYDGDGSTGHDTNPDGTKGPNPSTWGIATDPGATANKNLNTILSKIKLKEQPTVTGTGPSPSIAEADQPLDVNALFDVFKPKATVTYSGGSVQNKYCGTPTKPEITYFSGKKFTLSGGPNFGSGVLLLDCEEFVMSGDSYFHGLIIARVKKTVTLSGGPNPHIYGQFIVAPAPGKIPQYKQNGGGKVLYSSKALKFAEGYLGGGSQTYDLVHWNTW